LLTSRLSSQAQDNTAEVESAVSAISISEVEPKLTASSPRRNTRRMSTRDFFSDLGLGSGLALEEKTSWELLLASAAAQADGASNRIQDVVVLGHADG
jgi:hypothetical protein